MMPDLRFSATVIRPPADMIERMAADLINCNATSEQDAIRALMGKYSYGEIVAFADQAPAVAAQRKATR